MAIKLKQTGNQMLTATGYTMVGVAYSFTSWNCIISRILFTQDLGSRYFKAGLYQVSGRFARLVSRNFWRKDIFAIQTLVGLQTLKV